MADKTTIEWTDKTFNPWWGCTKVSPACDHCYAERLARFRYKQQVIWGKDQPRRLFGDGHWREPERWNAEAENTGSRYRVFCASQCDVMEDRADVKPNRHRLFDLIEATPHLDWQLLTKRPQNFQRFLPATWRREPRANVWLMATVESNDYLWRMDALKHTPAVVHGLSIEPLLEDVMPKLSDHLGDIEWIIVGGESGSKQVRPTHPDWVRRIRDEAQRRQIAFFFKQWGNHAPRGGELVYIKAKKDAGALLDGQEWREFPSLSLE